VAPKEQDMIPAEIERFLIQSLADRKLTGSEKEALADWLAQNAKTDQQKGVIRHGAFDLVRKAVADPEAARMIEWLEDVLRVVAPMQPMAAAHSPAEAAAFFSPGETCWRHIVHRLREAQRSADLCVFTITDDRISGAVCDAHLRGVKVRIITDNEKMHDAGSDIRRFLAAGIPVKLDDVSGPPASGLTGHMHHKFALFDTARLLFGSYNWTRGAANSNYEDLVDTTDPGLVAGFRAEFDRLWNKF
jgi:phosphatidylserine/phosphatidylglycerophosphate/cardiolipin synthase-like enzyme